MLTEKQVKLLEDLGFQRFYDLKDKPLYRWYKATKKWKIEVENGKPSVWIVDNPRYGGWFGRCVNEKLFPPWFVRTLSNLKKGGME